MSYETSRQVAQGHKLASTRQGQEPFGIGRAFQDAQEVSQPPDEIDIQAAHCKK